MKKLISALVALGALAMVSSMAAAEDFPTIACKKAAAPVKIDGIFDDQWKAATLINIAESDPIVAQYGKVWGQVPGDTKLYVQWDDTYLYFFAKKNDKLVCAPITDPGSGAPWLDDSIGMFVQYPDGSGFKAPISVPTPDGELLMGWAPVGPGNAEIRPEIGSAKVVKTSYGYDMEAALKWSEIGEWIPKAGDTIRFTPLIMDRDDEDTSSNDLWGQMMWVGDGDNPDVYGYMTFQK
jgi:hypothetical protein